MSTQALLDKIKATADEQVKAVEAETAEKVAAIETATKTEVAQLEKDAAAASDKEVAQIKRAALSKARQAGKLAVQTAKREAFDRILADAKSRVVGDDPATLQQWNDQLPELEMALSKHIG